MAKDKDQQIDDQDSTQHLPAIKPDLKTETHPETAVSSFAGKVEDLMNHAYQQSQPAEGQNATEHHQKFANWCNHLGDLWREVKKHA
jgi:hypothetical protein